MDIRKFFGVVPTGKKPGKEAVRNEKTKLNESTSKVKKGAKEIKVKKSPNEDDSKQRHSNKKKRIIYDSDSEPEETVPVKHSKKQSEKPPLLSKPRKSSRRDPVTYVSETDEDDDFVCQKTSLKPKENGASASNHLRASYTTKVENETQAKTNHVSSGKLTPTSVLDYFGTGSIQRSEKKLVASKRKVPSQNLLDLTRDDEAIAKQLQLEEDSELERQLHEDEEFAKTLALLDEAPKNKKARKDSEEKETFSPKKTTPSKAEKYTPSHKGGKPRFSDGSENSRPGEPIKRDGSGGYRSPKPPVGQGAHGSSTKLPVLNMSSKLALLKQKGESEKEKGAALGRKGNTDVRTEETRSPKKSNVSSSKTESVSPEDSDKKRTNYQAYRSYLNREGPKALGSKEIPQGAENCLEGLTFVITGVLESIERDEAKGLIERHGGKVTGSVSKRTSYLVMGRDSGQSKSDKASALGTKVIDEDGLLNLIRTMPGKKSKYETAAEAEVKKEKSILEKTPQKANQGKRKATPNRKASGSKKGKWTPEKDDVPNASKRDTSSSRKGLDFQQMAGEEKTCVPRAGRLADPARAEALLWVDKYRPTSLKTIIGQQGDQSCANKLLRWLKNWPRTSPEEKRHAKSGKFVGRDDGSSFKAALLSGPPGVGKTTTASLVCEELGYSFVELNASDTRSKNSLKEMVAESLNNTSIRGFCSGAVQAGGGKHALIMDEVDGMAGNEDRGGIQELIGLIRQTKIPIICMCNDRNHPKIRSLVHYCFDLRFQRPRVEQIKGAMMSIAFKEGLKIPPPAMNEIILGANQDIRQVLHNLSMWCAKSKALNYDQAKADSNRARKDIKLSPFDVARKVFAAGEETARMSLADKSDLFFHDYSIAPLFVQENYVHVKPAAAGGNIKKHLMLLSRAADSICDGDLVDRQIRSKQNWSLLPTQAIYSSVLPGELMRGYMTQFPSFPSWLGKHSSRGKHDRIVQELALHMSLRTHSSKRTVNLEYLPHVRDALVRPLTGRGAEGVQEAVALMDTYHLLREDFENVMEISSWGGKPSPFSTVDPKVKAAFTRAYNREAHLTPYSLPGIKVSKRGPGPALEGEAGEELNEDESHSEEQDQDSVEADAMIKKKTKSSKPSKPGKHEDPKKSKGRGPRQV
ncbi:replication factor C subunit 1 [Tachyglossus aculeatus]|uniref:replication factor C subunit 1 n=1 Tax=Tachyglossus aculeatus TaxID=9261 RepID=UPI0018F4E28B|nr:replication factor C subunit 1 [Tachyglossus aculeatus]